MRSLPLALLLTLLALAAPARAEEEVLLDQWHEQFLCYVKVGYSHTKLIRTDQGFRLEHHEWWPLPKGEHVTHATTETDAEGRIVSGTSKETSDLGEAVASVKRVGEDLSWTTKRRALPGREGKVEGAVYDSDVVSYLVATGKRKGGEVELRVLDLPRGAKVEKISFEQLGDQLHANSSDSLSLYEKDGKRTQTLRKDAGGSEDLAVNEAEAKDMTRKTKVERIAGFKPNEATLQGVTLRSPGQGWAVIAMPADAQQERDGMLMLIHPHEVFVIGIFLPVPLPTDPDQLQAFLPGLRESMQERDEALKLGKGKLTRSHGLVGLEYPITGHFHDEYPTKGRLLILRRNSQQALMLWLMSPSDKQAETKDLLAQAVAGLKVAPLAEPKVAQEQVTLPGKLQLTLPKDWEREVEDGQVRYTAPSGSQLRAWLQATGMPPEKVLDTWSQNFAAQMGATPPGVEPYELGKRKLFSATLSVERNNIQIHVRLITGADASGQTFMMMALETSLSPKGQMQKVLETATWK